jgi:alanine dehydrogenase
LTLILGAEIVNALMNPRKAVEALTPLMIEEAAGTTFHMPPFGASRINTFRVIGGGLQRMGRMGLRSGEAVLLFDTTAERNLLAVVGGDMGELRIGATLALAAQYLARPDARVIGLLGSGRRPLILLECLRLARPIERVEVYSPTPEHRDAFARKASAALGLPVTAHATASEALADADIVLTATGSREPVLTYADLHPGVHVTSMGSPGEIDESIFLQVDQFVTPSPDEEIDRHRPGAPPYSDGPLFRLIEEGKLDRAAVIPLGALIKGDVAPRNDPTDINLFRDPRGGIGDVALASWVYDRALEQSLGIEVKL